MKTISFILVVSVLCSCSSNTSNRTTVCGKIYPERQDDLCWENEYVGFRAYGPATQANGEKMFGYDLFLKRGTTDPIIESFVFPDADTTDPTMQRIKLVMIALCNLSTIKNQYVFDSVISS